MANPQQPASPSANAEPVHPLLRQVTQADKLMEAARARKEHREFQITELEAWKECVNGMAATPNGQLFLKSMIQHAGNLSPPQLNNPQQMVMNNIKAAFYLSWVRPYLNPELRKELEP